MNSYVLERSLRGEEGRGKAGRGERERKIRQGEKNEMSKPRRSRRAWVKELQTSIHLASIQTNKLSQKSTPKSHSNIFAA